MEIKAETPKRKARRKYEEINKEERMQSSKQFNTRLDNKTHEKICAFLKKHRISKVDLILAGYDRLRRRYSKKEK